MLQLKWGRSLSVWKEGREAGWMDCGGHIHNRRPAGVRRFCGDVLALWHCLEEVRNINPGCGCTAGCISNPADPRRSPRCLSPTVRKPSSSHKARNLLSRSLGIAKLQRREKKNLALSLPLYLRVCTYLLLKYRRRDWFSSLAAPLKKEGQGLNLCRVNTWLDFWKMLSFILLLPACQLDSWVFLCALRSAWSGPSDKAMCWASPVFSPCGRWTHLRMISQGPSLVFQWIKIRLPMQGTPVLSLV